MPGRAMFALSLLIFGSVLVDCQSEAAAARKLMNAESRAAKASRASAVAMTPPEGVGFPGLAATGTPGAHLENVGAKSPGIVTESYDQFLYDKDQENSKIKTLETKDTEEKAAIAELESLNQKLWVALMFLVVGFVGLSYYAYSKKAASPSGLSNIVGTKLNIPGRK
ncbi:hypothetical protein CYMTET_39716 [Cymbomonas tetramitiformis]|uniref:Transmembrane protein n=1 Tax=Cymbomonas tetramitiformis TaxID=36881 RepID=A0AAE0F3Z0_9CHLO|nr:hypothetical protein CYMTET_39717 [Cymbomonas tetramitiformis]KAK3250930.1 hypothetical protein CYMTET_39716 [Cymbomonas tetramitiformis]